MTVVNPRPVRRSSSSSLLESMILFLIALGGAAGSLLRYLIGGAVQRTSAGGFPVGTMFVNVAGCFLIGVFVRFLLNMQTSAELRALLVVGFCGGFTTFSTFSAETVGLIEGGEYARAASYVILSVVALLAATFAGMAAMRVRLRVRAMPGDPACWSHLFYDDENANEAEPMTKSSKAVRGSGAKAARGNRQQTAAATAPFRKTSRNISPTTIRGSTTSCSSSCASRASARSRITTPTRRRAAEWVKASLDKIGVPAKIYPTAGHPVVVGEWRNAPGAPTVLIYGHYDVQPAEPLDLWTSPPFEPTVRDEKIFARGSVDDKGQLFLHIKALEAHLATRGTLPVNVVVIAEGEEEIGSEHLAAFVEEQKKLLTADAVVISDSSMFAPGLPSILSSLRGLAYFEINVQGPTSDLHSGIYGGAIVNPAMALARILATFHDENGHIAIPGFYDKVRDVGSEDPRSKCARCRSTTRL